VTKLTNNALYIYKQCATELCFFQLFVRTRCKPRRKHETIQSASLDGCVYLVV